MALLATNSSFLLVLASKLKSWTEDSLFSSNWQVNVTPLATN